MIVGGQSYGPTTGYDYTEMFDGSTWTEVADLSTDRRVQGWGFSMTAGATTGFLVGGGTTPAGLYQPTYEEWAVPNVIKTFTAS